MFAKPFRVKSNSQLKGSERKKLRAELLQQFPLTEENLQELMPNKEVISCAKLHTHAGDAVLVYSVQKLPIVFQIESVMFPTVYMLWKIPDLVYYFTTWPPVLSKITGGADLMLPGVVLKDGFHIKAFGKLEKGDRVAVNLSCNKAAIAVGKAALSSIDMYMSGKRGKAVNVLHFVGDELWSYGTKLALPELGPPEWFKENETENDSVDISSPESPSVEQQQEQKENEKNSCDVISSSEDSVANLPEDVGNLNINENVDIPVIENSPTHIESIANSDFGDLSSFTEPQPEVVEDSKEAMDELVEYCFLKALNTSAKKAEYPMLASKFYKVHMLAVCPVGKSIDLKKSSHKKLSVFLNKMSSLEVIKVKELTKGVESIMSVNPAHPLIKNFETREDDVSAENPEQLTEVKGTGSPAITEMYIVTAAVLPLLSKFDLKKGMSLPAPTVRKHLTEYVKKEQLQDQAERRKVTLDPLLAGILKGKTDATSLTWDELMSKFLSCMTHSYSMSFAGQSAVVNKGKLEPIDIQVGKRTGNKKVTLINNLELYGVDLTEFARECQHGVAASTSISSVPGRKSAQLMVQGNQVLFVGNLLQGKYQIPKRYIRGLELAPKPKK
ncbi:eukaryotic translation initiation factor 2D [Anabrus simplex]|uniref:eukaryotic translation initiation factor 2D n=1 Tax=Anabrus simplex TaxID=316456 RepID=UPI0035A32F3A